MGDQPVPTTLPTKNNTNTGQTHIYTHLNVNLYLYIIKHYAVKASGEVEL
jgi:hypothetical protein